MLSKTWARRQDEITEGVHPFTSTNADGDPGKGKNRNLFSPHREGQCMLDGLSGPFVRGNPCGIDWFGGGRS